MAYEDGPNETITRAIGRVVDDVRDLSREEVALAKAELRHEASAIGGAAVRVGIGAGAGLFAVSFLWAGVSAVAVGTLGAVAFWPRRSH